jgi:hypothetical protein
MSLRAFLCALIMFACTAVPALARDELVTTARTAGGETTELIEMSGGTSTGDDCEAYAHHGYNGIEQAAVERIKAWIAKP